PRAAAEPVHPRPWIEPALAALSEAAACHPLDRDPWEARGETLSVEQRDIRPEPPLQRDIGAHDLSTLLAGQDQIALLAKADSGIAPMLLLQSTDQPEPVLRQEDVLLRRELLADAAAGQRRAGPAVGRIALDDQD